MPKLTVKKVPIAKLIPYANNARIHTEEQIDTIAASIEQFGFNDPVGVWTNPKGETEIVEGHGRVLAAEKLGMKEVPTINLDHLTDEQRKAYAIVHNQTTDNSVFDFAILDTELEALDFEWEEFGLSTNSFDAISDLLLNDFAGGEYDRDTFNITFSFPLTNREQIEDYVKEKGKEYFVNQIMKEAEKWA